MKRFSTSGIRGKVAPLSSFGAEVLWSTNPSTAKDIRQLVCSTSIPSFLDCHMLADWYILRSSKVGTSLYQCRPQVEMLRQLRISRSKKVTLEDLTQTECCDFDFQSSLVQFLNGLVRLRRSR